MGLVPGFTTCKKQSTPDPVSAVSVSDFEIRLDNLRQQSNIPGMTAGIVKDGQVTWTKNYGYADIQKNIPVTKHYRKLTTIACNFFRNKDCSDCLTVQRIQRLVCLA